MYHPLYLQNPNYFNKMIVNNIKDDKLKIEYIKNRMSKFTIVDSTFNLETTILIANRLPDSIDIHILLDNENIFETKLFNNLRVFEKKINSTIIMGKHEIQVISNDRSIKCSKMFNIFYNLGLVISYDIKRDESLPNTKEIGYFSFHFNE